MTTTLEVLDDPFVFTQSKALSTSDLVREAKRRGVLLDATSLAALHGRGELSPLLQLTDAPVTPAGEVPAVAVSGGTLLSDLRRAQRAGCIRDPAQDDTGQEEIRFDDQTVSDPAHWWNGLVYSRWQLLHADWLQPRHSIVKNEPEDVLARRRERGSAHRRLAVVLTVIESRYLPELEHGWTRLRAIDDPEHWDQWRDSFDPTVVAEHLGVDALHIRNEAEALLTKAKDIDPTGRWSRLIAQAPIESWKSLRGSALIALDLRVAGELLMRFYEDLAEAGAADPVGPLPTNFWNPQFERISNRRESLDETLTSLGVSPHPGAILLIEGTSEQVLVPHVFDHLGLSKGPDLVQVVVMNGVDKDLTMLAAATVAPLLGTRRGDGYDLLRPPCRLVIAVDPEGKWLTAESAERRRLQLVKTISEVAKAQAADVDTGPLGELVEVRRWNAPCFEYAHFDDDELLDAISTVHTNPNARPGDDDVLSSLSDFRARGMDIKNVWQDWPYQPPKPELSEALWPTLRKKIDAANAGARPAPPIVDVIRHTYAVAQQHSRSSWSLGVRDPDKQPAL